MTARVGPRPGVARLLGAFAVDVLLAATLFVLGVAVVMGAASWSGVLHADGSGADSHLLLLIVVAMALAGGGTYLLRRRASRDEVAAANAALARGSTWLWIALALALLQVLGVAMGWLESASGVPLEPANAQPIVAMLSAQPWPALLSVVLVAPYFEELLFRRVLFGRFLAAGRPWLGYALTGALFASLHEFPGLSGGGWTSTAMLWTFYFAMACVLAWAYRRTGSLWAPVLVHAAHNAIATWALG